MGWKEGGGGEKVGNTGLWKEEEIKWKLVKSCYFEKPQIGIKKHSIDIFQKIFEDSPSVHSSLSQSKLVHIPHLDLESTNNGISLGQIVLFFLPIIPPFRKPYTNSQETTDGENTLSPL